MALPRAPAESDELEPDLFQYIFARWDYRSTNRSIMMRHKKRFKTEIQNILLERKDKTLFIFDQATKKILFKINSIFESYQRNEPKVISGKTENHFVYYIILLVLFLQR